MTRQFFYACMFVLTVALQAGAITSLPEPLRFFPLTLVIGVILLHERSLTTGAAWIALSGLVLERWSVGGGQIFATLIAAVAALTLALFIFAKRSFWALMGVGTGTVIAYVAARWLWLMVAAGVLREKIDAGAIMTEGVLTILLAVLGTFVFGAYVRRLVHWLGNKFIRTIPDYDVA